MRGRKKSETATNTETLTVRLTKEDKAYLTQLAHEFGVPKAKIVSTLIEGQKILFISYRQRSKDSQIESLYKLAHSVAEAIEIMKNVNNRGAEVVFVAWLVKIKKGSLKAFEEFC